MKRTIDGYSQSFRRGNQPWIRQFVGSFSFQDLPEQLTPVTVDFELVVPDTFTWGNNEDWILGVHYRQGKVQLLGDSIFTWTGSHKPGDRFWGTLQFEPLASGFYTITLYAKPKQTLTLMAAITPGLTFGWCLNESGELIYLGNPESKTITCDYVYTHFFKGDTVFISGGADSRYLFDYQILVSPIPRIGDTSQFIYKLVAKKDFPNGIDLRLNSRHMKLVSLPDNLGTPLFVGDTLNVTVKAMPLQIQKGQGLSLQFWVEYGNKELGGKGRQWIGCTMHFNTEGNLQFINDETLLLKDKYVDANLPPRLPGGSELVILYKNGRIERIQ
ncbi:MAG: hypothetical protein IIA17_00305 [candidate division Zixibacteria bacterium]|nr:hypothetical protein [candidate division Zixibacteria bacterium]